MNKHLYVDFHLLQTMPPSCINRDDTGSPKTALYGGVTRARVSSQAWKHAIREEFSEGLLTREDVGQRTKKIVDLITKHLTEMNPALDAETLSQKAVDAVGIKRDKKGAKALFFMSDAQAKAIAELAIKESNGEKIEKKQYKEALRKAPSVDMVLFGRMVADDPSLNYDASSQVAHSISTHAVQNEYDYFTAVDDCAPEDNAGAGHLGTVEYNSSTMYRYATINVDELVNQLGMNKASIVVRAFAEAFICSMPTGKQNTFANRTLPDVAYVVIREDQPVNLCGAFEKPVAKSAQGYVEASKVALKNYAKQVYENFAEEPVKSFTVGLGLEELGEKQPLKKMLISLENAIDEKITGKEVE